MSRCDRCNKNGNVLLCDSCKGGLCQQCSDLSASELRCMELKKRKLIFLCQECENGFKQVPLLIKKINELEKQIIEIKETKHEAQMDEKEMVMNNEKMVTEIFERQKRASNVMMSNVKEQMGQTHAERNSKDKDVVKDVLKDIDVDMSNVSVFRVGKFNPEKSRLLKIVFPNSSDALNILKNKKLIKAEGVKIFSDQTKMQRAYFLSLKEKLKSINENGGNKTIKYINNLPTIVDAQQIRDKEKNQ